MTTPSIDRQNNIFSKDGRPLLYLVSEDHGGVSVDSVGEIKSNGEELNGEVVSLRARLFQERLSIQEFIEHSTNGTCGRDLFPIHTSEGTICVNIVEDVLVHGGAAWSTVPTSKQDVLFVFGVSSRHQDKPIDFVRGRYKIVGEIVHTSRINESLPDGSILLVYDLDRLGDIDWREVASETKQIIKDRKEILISKIRNEVNFTANISGSRDRDENKTNKPPIADFSIVTNNPSVGEKVTFNASRSKDSDGDIVEYRWDFDRDGKNDMVSMNPTATHTYQDNGSFSGVLEVVDDDGATNTTTKQIKINTKQKPDSIIDQYDINNNNAIEKSELRSAIIDFVNQNISRNSVRTVILEYVHSQT